MLHLFSKIWLTNLALAACIAFFGVLTFDVWSTGDNSLPEVRQSKNSAMLPPGKRIIERVVAPDSSYETVAGKNLFSSGRKESLPKKEPLPKNGSTEPVKISEKMIFLYGVVLAGDRKQALINNPESDSAAVTKQTRNKWIKIGDTLGNFSVSDIRKDRVILTEGANNHEILLYDKNKPDRKIVVAQPSAAPVAAPIRSTVPAATTGAVAPAVSGTPTAPGAPTGIEAPASVAPDRKSEPEGEYKIINTPFGSVKRRIQ